MNIDKLIAQGYLILDLDQNLSNKIKKLAGQSSKTIENSTNKDHKLVVDGVKEIFNLQFQKDCKIFYDKHSTLDRDYLELAYEIMESFNKIAIELAFECEKKLNFGNNFLSQMLKTPSSTLRPTYYFPGRSSVGDKHFDTSIFTFVSGETSSGLKVFNHNKVEDILYNENQMVVFFGEIFEFLTESKIKATIHQVIRNEDKINSSRTSIAYFVHGDLKSNFTSIPNGKYNFQSYNDLMSFIAKRNMAFFK